MLCTIRKIALRLTRWVLPIGFGLLAPYAVYALVNTTTGEVTFSVVNNNAAPIYITYQTHASATCKSFAPSMFINEGWQEISSGQSVNFVTFYGGTDNEACALVYVARAVTNAANRAVAVPSNKFQLHCAMSGHGMSSTPTRCYMNRTWRLTNPYTVTATHAENEVITATIQ